MHCYGAAFCVALRMCLRHLLTDAVVEGVFQTVDDLTQQTNTMAENQQLHLGG